MNILVTGASKGIGRAIADTMKTVGKVYITARNEKLLKEVDCFGYFACDLAVEDDLIKLGDFIAEKEIDILINNAGEYIYNPLEKTTTEDLKHIMTVNLQAPLYLSSRAVAGMKKRNFGRIINIGSISGVMGEAYAPLYSASKAGLIGFAKSAGLELAQFGITVNTINPGWVETELGKSSIDDSEFTEEELLSCIPQKRYVQPQEVADLVKYLSSDSAKGITGQSINLCAGLSVGI